MQGLLILILVVYTHFSSGTEGGPMYELRKKLVYDSKQLATELNASTLELTECLSCFTSETGNQKVNGTECSAAEVGEHLLILDGIANRVLRGDTKVSNRPPNEKWDDRERNAGP